MKQKLIAKIVKTRQKTEIKKKEPSRRKICSALLNRGAKPYATIAANYFRK